MDTDTIDSTPAAAPLPPLGSRSGVPVPVPRDAIFAGISVRPPYYALKDVCRFPGGGLTARISRGQALGHEARPIGSAEVGRHLAILGSCASADVNPSPGRHYFLARRARFRRLAPLDTGPGDGFIGVAHADLQGRSWSVARCALRSEEGVGLFELEVEYQVLSLRLFERLFRGACNADTPAGSEDAPDDDPHREAPALERIRGEPGRSRAVLRVDAPMCRGHFPSFPAMPVAKLAQSLMTLTSELFLEMTGASGRSVVVGDSRLEADRLAFAGSDLLLEARHVRSDEDGKVFVSRALLGDAIAGRIETKLSVGPGTARRP